MIIEAEQGKTNVLLDSSSYLTHREKKESGRENASWQWEQVIDGWFRCPLLRTRIVRFDVGSLGLVSISSTQKSSRLFQENTSQSLHVSESHLSRLHGCILDHWFPSKFLRIDWRSRRQQNRIILSVKPWQIIRMSIDSTSVSDRRNVTPRGIFWCVLRLWAWLIWWRHFFFGGYGVI